MTIRAAVLVLTMTVALPAFAEAPLDCVIRPKSEVRLGAAEEGKISEILVDRGDHVEAGQLVARLEDELQRVDVERTRVRAASDVEVRSQQKRHELRQRELQRATRLQTRGVAPETALDDARIEEALTALAVEQAAMEREIAEIEHRLAQARLERRTITAPVSGVVTEVEAAMGEFAHEQFTILRIAEIDPLYVEVFAPPGHFGRFTPGQEYEIRPAPPLEGSYWATVTVVDSIFDIASGTFGVRLELPNPDGTVPVGVRCSLILEEGS